MFSERSSTNRGIRGDQQLDLDGILCHEKTPVIYFRQVPAIEASAVADPRRRFWNQGHAPILVLIDPDQVHVYSGFASPWTVQESSGNPTCLVQQLNRTEVELRSFIVAVESGDDARAEVLDQLTAEAQELRMGY